MDGQSSGAVEVSTFILHAAKETPTLPKRQHLHNCTSNTTADFAQLFQRTPECPIIARISTERQPAAKASAALLPSLQNHHYKKITLIIVAFPIFVRSSPCVPPLSLFENHRSLVYDPKSVGNEEDSDVLFRNFSEAVGLSPSDASTVSSYIIATKRHDVSDSEDQDLRAFIDLDMAVVGRERGEYFTYASQVKARPLGFIFVFNVLVFRILNATLPQ